MIKKTDYVHGLTILLNYEGSADFANFTIDCTLIDLSFFLKMKNNGILFPKQTHLSFYCIATLQKFFCGGRCIFGPDVKSLFLTLSLILVPMILFWAFDAEGLISEFPHGYLMVALSVVLTAYVSFSILCR